MKTLSNYIEERLIIFTSQVNEKLVINKDYKTSPFDDDTLMLVKFMKRSIVSRNPVLIVDGLKNVDVQRLNDRVYSISGQEVNSRIEWDNKKFISDNNDIMWELKTDSRSNFISFNVLFTNKNKFHFDDLLNAVGNEKLYTVEEIYKMIGLSSYYFPSYITKILRDNEKYEVIYYRRK